MALASNEVISGGHGLVIDRTTGALVVTTNTTGASWHNGWLKDPDGRLVVVQA